ncbi:hypothetical protein FI667_g15692, partial [Globisporangium splendens]
MRRRNHDDRVVMHGDTDPKHRLSVWLVDLEGKLTANAACDSLNCFGQGVDVVDGYVDTDGNTVVLVDASPSRLWRWTAGASTSNSEGNCDASQSEWQGEWMARDLSAPHRRGDCSAFHEGGAKSVRTCWAGRFVCSSLLGRCFLFICVKWDLCGAIRLREWTIDIELKWQPIQYASIVIPVAELSDTAKEASSHQKPPVLQLRMNPSWSHAAIAVQNTLLVVPVTSDLDGGNDYRLKRSISLEQDIADVTWVDGRSTLALLVAHGQVLVISLCGSSGLDLLDIETQSTTSKRLSLSALMNKAVSSASHAARVDDKLRNHLEQTPSPSAVVLIHIARLALYESGTTCVQDVFFTLMSIGYQQVKSASNMDLDDQPLIEGLLSLAISVEPRLRHRISAKILAAPPAFSSRAERRAYYHREMSDLAQICQSFGQTDGHASTSPSRAATTASYFQVYLPTIMDRIHELISESELVDGQSVLQSLSFCQRMAENHFEVVLVEAEKASGTKKLHTGADDARVRGSTARDSLLLIVLAYTMTCTSLRIDTVVLDLPHIVSIAKLRGKGVRKEQLVCFATLVSDTLVQDFLSVHNRTATPSWNLEKALIGRCGNPEEVKFITKFVNKAQDAVSCEQWHHTRLSFDNYQQLFNRSRSGNPSHFRVDKIVRTLAMVIWAIWIRERCAYCMRSIELLKRYEELNRAQHIGDEERKQIGPLAATCALQLNVLGILAGKTDDAFALQISLLEVAAKLNSSKATAVVCWAFPADKIQARYLKRYKALRAALKAGSDLALDGPPIGETEHRCRFIQRHVKKSIRWSITSGSMKAGSTYPESPRKHEMTRSWTSEIDALVNCCCDLEFQKTTWELIQKRFVGGSKALVHDDNKNETNKDELKKLLLESRASMVDGFISRQEVMSLLQEQKRELEGKVQSLSRTSEGENELCAEPLPVKETRPSLQPRITANPTSLDQAPAQTITLANKSYMTREILQDEDDSENQKRKRKLSQQMDRRESVQNVLKLLSLQKQQPDIHKMDSARNLAVSPGAQRSRSQRGVAKVPEGVITSGSTPSPKRHVRDTTVRRAMSFAARASKDIREEQPDQGARSAARIPPETLPHPERAPTHVFPLRYDRDMEASSLKFLDPNSAKSISFKTKQFTFQEREARGANRTVLRTSAQTESADRGEVPGPEQGKPKLEQQRIKVSVTKDSETQSEIEKKEAQDTQEASIQCRFQEKPPQQSRKTNREDDTSSLLRKYPVFVDLKPRTSDQPNAQRYLQVVRFAKHSSQGSNAPEVSQVAVVRETWPEDAILPEQTTPEAIAKASLGEQTTTSEATTDRRPPHLSEQRRPARDHEPFRLHSLRELYRGHSQEEQALSPETQRPTHAIDDSEDQMKTATATGDSTTASAFSKKATEDIVEAKIEKLALGDDGEGERPAH